MAATLPPSSVSTSDPERARPAVDAEAPARSSGPSHGSQAQVSALSPQAGAPVGSECPFPLAEHHTWAHLAARAGAVAWGRTASLHPPIRGLEIVLLGSHAESLAGLPSGHLARVLSQEGRRERVLAGHRVRNRGTHLAPRGSPGWPWGRGGACLPLGPSAGRDKGPLCGRRRSWPCPRAASGPGPSCP